MKTPAMWFAVASLMIVGLTRAQPPDPWIGRRVFTQFGTVLKVGDRVVDDQGRAASLRTSGKDRNTTRVYWVEHTNGEWLWLKDETSGISGWVQSKYVIPYEEAIDFYTNQIRANRQPYLYNSRGMIWEEQEKHDLAIADFSEAIHLKPSEALFFCNRGLAWGGKGDFDKAIDNYNEAIHLDPKYVLAYRNRGIAWDGKADYDKAITDYNAALRLDPKYAWAYYNRGNAWFKKGDYDKAIADFNKTIRLNPKFAWAYYNRGCAWCDKGDYDKAIADFNEAIHLDPTIAWAYDNRGCAWMVKKDYEKAVADFNEAIRRDPKNATTYGNRGSAWMVKKDYEKAVADFNEVIRLNPKSAIAFNSRAWVWATCPVEKFRDGKRAVESANRACELGDRKDAVHSLDTLAAAYAEAGDFAKAVEWQEKLNKLYTDAEHRKKGEERLKLYREKKPYRDEG